MKICPNCRNIVEDNANFCDKCGTRFTVQNNVQANYSQQPNNQANYMQQQQYNYGVNQPQYQPTTPQNQPTKKNTGMIIGIIAAVLIVLAIIGSVAQKAFQDQGYGQSGGSDNSPSYYYDGGDSYDDDNSSTTDNSVSSATKTYDKGTVVDGWYINEWANMRFDTSGSWIDGSAEEYGSYEGDPNTECGVILNDVTNGKQLVICFEKLNGLNVYITEEAYLDIITSSLKQQYADANLTCAVDDYYDTTIAGETFKTAKFTFDGSTMVQAFHVRNYDGYIIFVAVMALDDFDASGITNNIRTVD